MGKLEELRQMVSDLFAEAEKKEVIEKAALVSNKIDEVEKEQNLLVDKDAELLKSYKDLVLHTSFKEAPSAGNNPAASGTVSFDDMLKQFIENGGK